ncbi:MAG: LysM peptidoglycan-binding domain-containing protein [Candidatus Kerfeldbacteria bacterium]|nr:LysM peptidoglycan-binding domain-containing protein [Candidatus Kerfeldbacteria bacterium]
MPLNKNHHRALVESAYFAVCQFAKFPIAAALFIVEIPIHLKKQPTESFSLLARRSTNLEYLDSYSLHVKKYRWSVATSLGLLLVFAIQVSLLANSLVRIAKPTQTEAYSTSIDINPTWDITSTEEESMNDCFSTFAYYCYNELDAVMSLGRTQNPIVPCDGIFDGLVPKNRVAMKFSLSSIPNNATVTQVQIIVNVSDATNQQVTIHGMATDTPDLYSCDTGELFSAINSGTFYGTDTWSTLGVKTVTLSAAAVTAVQTRLTGSDLLGLGLFTAESSNNAGAISSVNHSTPANRPILRVSYTLPPQAPTSSNHGAITTTTIAWTWTDNATADTSNVIHDSSHIVKCTTGAVSGTGSTGTCTETGLSANTQYTRHPNAVDADGNTDGPSMSAYSAVEAITSISPSTASSTTLTVGASSVTNLGVGQTAVYYDDTTSGQNSGWITTTTWLETGLQPNTTYAIRAKSRNAEGVETAFSSTSNFYTTAAAPNLTPGRSTSTWYNAGNFTFTNAIPWGDGGVQYYAYIWDTTPTHNFSGGDGLIWADQVSHCPGGGCDVTNATLSLPATSDGASWYIHVQAYDLTETGWDNADYGPFYFDATAPTTPATVNDGTGADATTTASTTTLSANWTASTDATSGLLKYQYAIGTTSGGTNVLTYTDNGTSTTVTNTSLTLTNGQTYYISVRAVDNANNTGGVRTSNGITVDAVGPSFTNISSTSTSSSFAVTWTSTEPSMDQLEYGLTTSYGSTTTVDGALGTSHSASATGLASNTTYHFRLKGTDALGNTGTSPDQQISTSAAPQTLISNVQVSAITESSVTVTWTTNEAATSKVRYGLTTAYGLEVFDATLVTSHSLTLTGLTAGTAYHYEVISVGSTTDNDADATFTTTATAVTPPTATPTTPEAAAPTITNLTENQLVGDTKPTIAGTGPAGGSIYIIVDRRLVRTVPVDASGHYLVDLADDLALGTHVINVRSRSAAGVISAESAPRTFTIVRPSIGVSVLKKIIVDGLHPSITFYVVGPGHTIITLLLDGQPYKTFDARNVPLAYGFITKVAIPTDLAAGRHRFSFMATDLTGRPSRTTGQTIFDTTAANQPQTTGYKSATSYVVQPGDTLWSIAATFLGDGHRWTDIQQANLTLHPSLVTSPQTIHVGWTLTIPSR